MGHFFNQEDQVIAQAEEYLGQKPRIVVCGKTGAGKSSLINALIGHEVNQIGHCEPTTQKEQEESWSIGLSSLRILDVPGFGEADKHEDRLDFIFQQLPTSHVGLLVVGAPDRAWEYERQFLEAVRAADPNFPILVVGNRIDMFNPIRDWNPQTLNLQHPTTAKEHAILEWALALRQSCGIEAKQLILTSAGESFKDEAGRYGLKDLAQAVVNSLPAAMRNAAARSLSVEIDKRDLAEKLILAASVAASAVALTPIPFADCIPLAGIQLGLIIKIADIYGKVMTKSTALNLLSPVAASFAGRMALAGLLDLFPGIGTTAGAILGAGIAGPMTYAIGKTYLEFFARNNFKPSREEVLNKLKNNYQEAKKNQVFKDKAN
ncbi:MAG: DUF697 domain-containing protein [Desulfovibrionaceae bacterium]|nr:DUF697 domain-containing protein [Desulfovibrionaceae bacterium]